MAMLVGQLIEILKQFDQDREVMIHTLSGQNAEVEYYIDDAEGEAHIIGTGNVNFFTTQTGF